MKGFLLIQSDAQAVHIGVTATGAESDGSLDLGESRSLS